MTSFIFAESLNFTCTHLDFRNFHVYLTSYFEYMMEKFSEKCYAIFEKATDDYHRTDDVDALVRNPYKEKSIEFYLYLKNRIDAVQWHLEDIIRDPDIDPVKALAIKRRIDQSNQDRTDLVERIDSYFFDLYKDVNSSNGLRLWIRGP